MMSFKGILSRQLQGEEVGGTQKTLTLIFDAPPKLQLAFQHNGRYIHRSKKVPHSLQNKILRDSFGLKST